jgi:hypothetical protein
MVGIFAETYRIGNIVKKVYRRFPNDDIATEESIEATPDPAEEDISAQDAEVKSAVCSQNADLRTHPHSLDPFSAIIPPSFPISQLGRSELARCVA